MVLQQGLLKAQTARLGRGNWDACRRPLLSFPDPNPKPLISTTHPTLHLHHQRTLPTFTWNTILRRPPSTHSPLSIYSLMRRHLVPPDSHTFPFLLSASASASSTSLTFPSDIHAQAFLFNFSSHPHAQTSLIDAYSSRGDFEHARRVFEEARRFSYVLDLASWNAVINGCLKVGLLAYARKVFEEMPGRNVRSWSCMINGYVRFGEYKKALGLFRRMQVEETWVRPNEFTMSGVLSACGKLGALEHGNWVQEYIDRCGMEVDVVLGTCLIDMYSKCGCIGQAMSVFRRLKGVKDVTVWTAMISGLAMNGMGNECFALFSEMSKFGVQPNAVTILGVLCGCVHGGMVTEGEELFSQMEEVYGLVPMIQHYGCLIDLYARTGSIDKAWNVVRSMPMEPDVLIWGALLSGARTHGDKQTCEIALRRIIELDPSNSGAYILLSNLYAKMGRWSDVRSVRNSMDAHGISKVPGCSLVELNGVLHEFFVGDDTHPESREIYMMLDEIMLKLKKEGYVGNTNEVLLDLDEEGKEVALSLHSEKVAVAFCFLKTSPGTPIRIIKNLRICPDCHVAMKMISKVYKREIVVRDCNRFHHFRDGVCSCKDFW